jgi:hypothetical protein
VKKDTAKHDNAKKTERRQAAMSRGLDGAHLINAIREAFEWGLDVAARLVREYPEDADAVERVRAFMRARMDDRPASVAVDDVLFTFGLLMGSIDRELAGIVPGSIVPPVPAQVPVPHHDPRIAWRRPCGASRHVDTNTAHHLAFA